MAQYDDRAVTETALTFDSDHSNALVHPVTGELIPVDEPVACLRLLGEIRTIERTLRELKSELTSSLSVEFSRQGTKTLEIEGIKAELRGGSEVVWDVEVLEELRDAGLPEERFTALITTEITYKVNASVAKQLAGANPEYAEIIERARNVIPKAEYVLLK